MDPKEFQKRVNELKNQSYEDLINMILAQELVLISVTEQTKRSTRIMSRHMLAMDRMIKELENIKNPIRLN